jgi:hypothetical protein
MNLIFSSLTRSFRRIAPVPSGRAGRWLALAAVLFGTGSGGPAAAGPAEASESQVKAAFLLNFPKYVEWPAETFATTNSPIVVTVMGDAAVAADLGKMITGKTVNGRPLVLKQINASAEAPRDSQILFIGATVRRSAEVLAQVRPRAILTVGEGEDFLPNGGAIRFARRDQKIRLEINPAAATHAQLKISSKLLSVADVVKGATP